MGADFSDKDKLEVIEFLIEQWRPARSSDISGERETLLLLKQIAKDIRGRMPGVPQRARDRLQRALADATASKTSGYPIPALRRIAEVTISEWATIRQALDEFEKEISK